MPDQKGTRVMATSAPVKARLINAVLEPFTSSRFSMTKPAWAYSSRYIQAIARKWGICQVKRIPNKTHAPRSNEGRAAVQPITGGIAPEMAPTIVHHAVRRLSGV